MDFFDRVGLPRRFAVDAAALEQAYLARSRALHPDYHRLGSSADQAASTELSASLNEAYTTLKDPFKRAEYLLQLAGGPTAGEYKDVPGDFLNEMLETRMGIAELSPGSPAAAALEKQLTDRRDTLLAKVGSMLDGSTPTRLVEARRLLNATKYVQNLIRDLRAM
ncbi:MAG TPA: Fe-S protein assembly co-chaperone HscB [Gemmataceae bacterium]|jgi:molecular chaperone HscB|nr:Fe-S protein assembly co-chaperone HscB [Gemmataceae bacterium]